MNRGDYVNIEKIIAVLIKLLGEQEGANIEYTLERKDPEEKTA